MKKIHHDWLDYARFFAALSVCWFHYCANGIRGGKITSITGFGLFGQMAEYGYLGVDLFFVVSGFVILYSAVNKPADQFVVARIVRLYPAYLFCMTLTAVVLTVWGKGVGFVQYLANLTMIAAYIGFNNIDGVYWTLGLELIFYAAVWVVIILGQMKRMSSIVFAWLALMVVFKLLDLKILFFSGYFSLFAGGCILAFIYRQGFNLRNVAFLTVAIVLSVLNAVERSDLMDVNRGIETRSYIAGLITGLIFLIFIVFKNISVSLPFARVIGSLTYPLYLLHAYIGYTILSKIGSDENRWSSLFIVSILMIAASWLVARYVEEAPRKLWNSLAEQAVGGVARFFGRIGIRSLAGR